MYQMIEALTNPAILIVGGIIVFMFIFGEVLKRTPARKNNTKSPKVEMK